MAASAHGMWIVARAARRNFAPGMCSRGSGRSRRGRSGRRRCARSASARGPRARRRARRSRTPCSGRRSRLGASSRRVCSLPNHAFDPLRVGIVGEEERRGKALAPALVDGLHARVVLFAGRLAPGPVVGRFLLDLGADQQERSCARGSSPRRASTTARPRRHRPAPRVRSRRRRARRARRPSAPRASRREPAQRGPCRACRTGSGARTTRAARRSAGSRGAPTSRRGGCRPRPPRSGRAVPHREPGRRCRSRRSARS